MKKLILYSFILLMSHCKDTYNNIAAASHLEVPPFTETGANTFGCLVNGQPWANFGENWVVPAEDIFGTGQLEPNLVRSGIFFDAINADSAFSVSAGLTISKAGVNTRHEMMSLEIPVPTGGHLAGIYELTSSSYLFSYRNYITEITYSSLIRSPFTVTVKKDSITTYPNRIVSGTFSGTLYNNGQTDSLRITGGVFDVLVE